MPSMIGFASLSGIVVNNAILFLTFFQTHLEGDDYIAASLNAVRDRFRPILLSSSTTFAGLVPIMFDTSPQVQTMVPLVVSVAFGLLGLDGAGGAGVPLAAGDLLRHLLAAQVDRQVPRRGHRRRVTAAGAGDRIAKAAGSEFPARIALDPHLKSGLYRS